MSILERRKRPQLSLNLYTNLLRGVSEVINSERSNTYGTTNYSDLYTFLQV